MSHYFVVSTKKGQGKQGQLETISNLLQILRFFFVKYIFNTTKYLLPSLISIYQLLHLRPFVKLYNKTEKKWGKDVINRVGTWEIHCRENVTKQQYIEKEGRAKLKIWFNHRCA